MAKPTTRSWTKLSIWPGDGGSPEDFAQKVCGMTSKGFTLSSDVSETNVPDCDDPDLPGWVERVTRSNSADLTGSGLLAEENFDFYNQWKLSGEEKNVRVVLDLAGTPGYYEGPFLLTTLEITGTQDDGKINLALTFQSAGVVSWATGAP